ncbi:LPS export ABC transporter permease LptG [Kingella negevensis]|uniref:LPS export ABC transporter permease LptG n=1 Tax=Kingella negevensis TaxID=1522312 RepID=UPI002543EF29|nr:LPS export ABC transporter permease LptG [Kingella negevensis]WII93516.1 LPS export ABC transporter permease LptG [Kingella negevensis]
MKLLTRYLIVRLSVMSGYALLAILALYSFIDLLSEITHVGVGVYNGWDATKYILMQMPARAYQLMPLATLIGGLIALSQLSSNSELAVIKTSGLSTRNIIMIIVKFSAIFAVITVFLGEWIAPELNRRAEMMRTSQRASGASATYDGLWIKQPESMVSVAAMLPDHTLTGIKIWRYNQQYQLVEAVTAEKATIANGKWTLKNVQSSTFADNRVYPKAEAEREWQTNVSNNLLDILLVQPEQMSFSALTKYINYLKSNQQQTLAYDVAWWNKLVYPIATMVMALVALAFTPNSGRHSNMGLKLFGGICLGLLFFFSGRLFGFTAQLYGVPAFIAAILPTATFALWAGYLIRKQEAR